MLCAALLTAGNLHAVPAGAVVDAGEPVENDGQRRVNVLYFAATYCAFCAELSEDVIRPMRINDEYRRKVKISEILLDVPGPVTAFGGKAENSDKLVLKYDIDVTPTLLFVDEQGREIAERMVGYQSKDFYWFYLDKAIDEALVRLNQADK